MPSYRLFNRGNRFFLTSPEGETRAYSNVYNDLGAVESFTPPSGGTEVLPLSLLFYRKYTHLWTPLGSRFLTPQESKLPMQLLNNFWKDLSGGPYVRVGKAEGHTVSQSIYLFHNLTAYQSVCKDLRLLS